MNKLMRCEQVEEARRSSTLSQRKKSKNNDDDTRLESVPIAPPRGSSEHVQDPSELCVWVSVFDVSYAFRNVVIVCLWISQQYVLLL